jgi:hypothetical protein
MQLCASLTAPAAYRFVEVAAGCISVPGQYLADIMNCDSDPITMEAASFSSIVIRS